MKNLLAGIALIAFSAFASAQTINFDNVTLDYGTIKKGSDGNRDFVVTNTGDKPLIISNVKPGCGCTTPSWSKDPILPGKSGKISVHYDTNNPNSFQKIIEVFSNDPVNSRSVIYIKGNVIADAAATDTATTTNTKVSGKATIAPAAVESKAKVKSAN